MKDSKFKKYFKLIFYLFILSSSLIFFTRDLSQSHISLRLIFYIVLFIYSFYMLYNLYVENKNMR